MSSDLLGNSRLTPSLGCQPSSGPADAPQVRQSGHEPLGQKEEDDHENYAMDNVGVAFQKSQEMGEDSDERGAEQGAPDGAHAAHHHHDDQVQGLEDAEGLRINVAEVVGVETAGHRREDRREDEHGDFLPAHVHSQGRGGYLVFGQGGQTPAYPAPHQIEAESQGHQGEGPNQIVKLEVAVEGQAADGQGRYPGKAAGAAGDRVPLYEDAVHDIVEPQGGHGQVMADEPQGGNPDDQGHPGHGRGGEDHGRPGRHLVGGGQDGRAVGPQAEKRGMSQGDLAGETDKQVKSQDNDDVQADEVEDAQVIGVAHDQGRKGQEDGQTPHHQAGVVAEGKISGFVPNWHGVSVALFLRF